MEHQHQLLILTTYSDRIPRIQAYTKYLPEHGWKTHLVSKETAPCPICPHNLPKGKGKINNALKWLCIPDLDVTWLPVAEKKAWHLMAHEDIDAILTSAPPYSTLLLGIKLAKKHKIPHIADYRDPWIGNQIRRQPTKIHLQLEKQLELHIDMESEAIIQVTDRHREEYLKNFPQIPPEKVWTIPNGYDPEIREISKASTKNKDKNKDKYTIAYIGTLLPNYDTSFLDDIKRLYQIHPEARRKIRVIFAGRISTAKAKEIAKYRFAENLGLLPRKKAIETEADADLLIFSLSPEPQYKTVISGRIYEYIATGKRILAITHPDGLAADLVRKTNSGTIIPHGDHEAILRELTDLWNRWKRKEDTTMKKNLKPLEKYNRKNTVKRLAEILNKLNKTL